MLDALVLTDVLKMKDQYGSSKIGEGKTVIVEFSSPNSNFCFKKTKTKTIVVVVVVEIVLK